MTADSMGSKAGSTGESGDEKRRRVVRGALLALAGALVLYALSDDPFLCGGPGFGGPEILLVGSALVLAAGAFAPFRWGSRLLLLSVVGLVSFGLAEAVLVPILGPVMREPYQYDEELIFVTRPGTTKLYRLAEEDGGAVVRSEINDAGYRGPDLVDDPDLRVVVYGDSFIHALYAEEEDTFCRRLEAHLGDAMAGRRVEVVNAGVSSYGPDQALLRMRRDLPSLAPDLVVLAVFTGNDFGDLDRNKLFRLTDDGGIEAEPWELREDIRQGFERAPRKSLVMRGLQALAASGAAGDGPIPGLASGDDDAAVRFFLEAAEKERAERQGDLAHVVTNPFMDFFSADVALEPEGASAEVRRAQMRGVLGAFRDHLAAEDVPLVVVAVPHPVDVVDAHSFGPIDTERHPGYRRTNLTGAIVAIGAELTIPVVDLFGPFRNADDPATLYFKTDDHWTPPGQDLAADVTAAFIVREGLGG